LTVNLTDAIFNGIYRGKTKHADDLEAVISRAHDAGVGSMIITGISLNESRKALELARKYSLYATVGCHPTHTTEFKTFKGGPNAYLQALEHLLGASMEDETRRVVAIGECGLDYDRTRFSVPEVQKHYFRMQLGLAKRYHLPLFLHSRAAHADFVKILRDEGFGNDGGRDVGGKGGVVHSFTGSIEEAQELMDMGFHIGINGCSLKTEENLRVAGAIRLDRLLLETDAPWCSVTSGHTSHKYLDSIPSNLRDLYDPPSVRPEKFICGKAVKGRNEPSTIGKVAWIVHCLHPELSLQELMAKVWNNTIELFQLELEEL
ncbi:Mg-dependent DNase, partial [Amanita rubescens]